MDRRQRLLALYDEFPFEHHPMWVAVLRGELSKDEVIRAEAQHWVRTSAGQVLRRDALNSAKGVSDKIFGQLLETFLEECTNQRGTSHLDLIERLVVQGGFLKADLESLVATPGNAAAIALYRDITGRGAGCHMLGAGTVEHFYSQLSPRIYAEYTPSHAMPVEQLAAYNIYIPLDTQHPLTTSLSTSF